jgi:gliding motility-associated-like protein
MKLFKAGASGSVNDLMEIPLTDFPLSNPQNNTGSNWRKGCIDAGTYYLFWAACGDTLDIFEVYQPRILFESHPGDYCATAVPINLVGEGQAWASLTVDCHTIGTELLDGPESYDCLLGPEGYKSSFFVLNLIGPDKRDVTFSMAEFTTATFEQIRYRVLPGYCGAATPGLCSSDPNTAFTLNCLGAGSYIIQVVTIASAEGDIAFSVNAVNSPNQNCVPLDPYQPNAFFTYDACEGDTIYFENQSTFGEDMVYEWIFPDYSTSERNPKYYYPRPSALTYITVSLLATNTATGASDFITLQVEISPILEPIEEDIFLVCEGDSVLVTAQNYHSFAEYDWSDGQYGATVSIVEPGQYFVSVSNVRCPQYDSVEVVEVYCDSLYLEACDSVGYANYLIYESGFFMDTIDGGITLDTLRNVTVVINSIDQVVLDPAFLEIEIGDQVELQAYTNAQDPIYTWQPFDLLEFIREDKVRLMPPRSTIVTLLVEDADGCLKEAETVIEVSEIYNDVFIPNAFSPNHDGVNDYFFPFGADHIVEVADFQVFDRWGALVFQNDHFQLNDWREGWDGDVHGQKVAAGVYVYFSKITYINGAVILFKGDVTVMR